MHDALSRYASDKLSPRSLEHARASRWFFMPPSVKGEWPRRIESRTPNRLSSRDDLRCQRHGRASFWLLAEQDLLSGVQNRAL